MNKPRPSALPLNKAIRVTPPTPPRFFSFSSFRIKKSQRDSETTSDASSRRRTASGDCDYSSASDLPTIDALLPTADSDCNKVYSSIEHGGVSTFKSFGSGSAPPTPCSRPDYRFVKQTGNVSEISSSTSAETGEINQQVEYYGSQLENGCGFNRSLGGTASEMHKGYFDKNGGTNHSITDVTELHSKPPSGVIRHQTLRSNSEPHGHNYYGGGAEVNVGSTNHGVSNIYGNNIVLEDQGIDMSQSPGHESPSSTVSSNTISVSGGSGVSSSAGSGSTGHSRHSAASFDSGRASSSLYQQGVRYSGLSSESSSTGSCRHSYHSSSSSLGSIPPEEICNFDVSSMVSQGLPDSEILNAWLTGVHFECYYQNFIQAGYDMQTIVKMTPEDLNAIGITKPNHRKRLKSEISQLIIPDGLPAYIPNTIEEWLRALRMEEYADKLKAQGYMNVRQVTNITWEDLEDIGILKLGHQKKFLLAIKRVEDILSGKRLHTSGTQNSYHPSLQESYAASLRNPHLLNHASQMPYSQHAANHGQMPSASRGYNVNSFQQKGFTSQQSVPPFSTWRQHSVGKEDHYSSYHHGEGIYSTNDKPHMQLLTHQPQIHQEKPPTSTNGLSQPEYHPEVIAIHVKNERRPSAIADPNNSEPIYGTSSFQAPTSQNMRSNAQSKWMEDGETTPTNEAEAKPSSNTHARMESTSCIMGNSTLPRLMKNKAFGKTAPGSGVGHEGKGSNNNDVAATGLDVTYQDPAVSTQWQQHQSSSMDGYKSLPKNMGRFQSTFRGGGASGPPGMKQPPPPPRRSSSSSVQDGRQDSFSTFHPASCSMVKQQPSAWSNNDHDLPAPPPPEDLAVISGSSSENPVPNADSSQSNYSVNNTSTSTSLIASSNNAASSSSTGVSSFHQYTTYANNASTNIAAAYSNNSSRIYPSTSGRLRDPSPGACDSDLNFSSVGVRRNGSDASFKSSSSTESESLPFANDNAGTIKQQKPNSRSAQGTTLEGLYGSTGGAPAGEQLEAGDVLSDIGNMLADLTDELDAILQQEMDTLNKR